MIKYKDIKVGDILKIVEPGAPGFANIGDLVKVTKILPDPGVQVVLPNGNDASFVWDCGAARLETTHLVDFPSHIEE